MNHNKDIPEADLERFSRAVVSHINASADQLPHEITERLRAARMHAIAKRRGDFSLAQLTGADSHGVVTLGGDPAWRGIWGRVGLVLPLFMLLIGLVGIGWIQDEMQANELAIVDAELLLDELPPAAYVDPGFAQFLRRNQAN